MGRLAQLSILTMLVAARSAAQGGPAARLEADLLARAGEAKYRLAVLRASEMQRKSGREGHGERLSGGPSGGPAAGSDVPALAEAVGDLEEAARLDPLNLRALTYLGLARLEAARLQEPGSFDPDGFARAREPFQDLFRLTREWAEPVTRAMLREVERALDQALGAPGVRPPEAGVWWKTWRGGLVAPEGPTPGAEVTKDLDALRSAPAAWEREEALERLAAKAPTDPKVHHALAKALREDASPWVRAAASRAIGGLGFAGWDVRLAEALRNDPHVWVRQTCARLLGLPARRHTDEQAPSPPGRAARAALADAFAGETPRVAAEAVRALGALGGFEATLAGGLASPSRPVREAAALALAGSSLDEAVARQVAVLLADGRPEVRAAAARALWSAAPSGPTLNAVLALLSDPDASARAAAAGAFRHGAPEVARGPLARLLDDPDASVRLMAATGLAASEARAATVLESLVRSELPVDGLIAGDPSRLVAVKDLAREALADLNAGGGAEE